MSKLPLAALLLATFPALSIAADRAIPLSPVVSMSWGYVTPGTTVNPHRLPSVGFWQRSSGAKQGVGAVFVATMEYQLPEAPASRVRSATFQFSGRQSQCSGAEPVVIDVYAYPANGRGEAVDASAGTRVAQMSADCTTNPAFNQPIDVTAIVRQLSVPAGIRHVGFNMRKANNRQGPGLFGLSAGKLTVVLADGNVAAARRTVPPAMAGAMPDSPSAEPMAVRAPAYRQAPAYPPPAQQPADPSAPAAGALLRHIINQQKQSAQPQQHRQ